jgi:hypothetical protein
MRPKKFLNEKALRAFRAFSEKLTRRGSAAANQSQLNAPPV